MDNLEEKVVETYRKTVSSYKSRIETYEKSIEDLQPASTGEKKMQVKKHRDAIEVYWHKLDALRTFMMVLGLYERGEGGD